MASIPSKLKRQSTKVNQTRHILFLVQPHVFTSGVRAELMRGATPSASLHPSVLHWLQTNPRSPYASYYHQHLTSSPSTGGSRLLSARTQGCQVLTPFLQSLPAGSRCRNYGVYSFFQTNCPCCWQRGSFEFRRFALPDHARACADYSRGPVT